MYFCIKLKDETPITNFLHMRGMIKGLPPASRRTGMSDKNKSI